MLEACKKIVGVECCCYYLLHRFTKTFFGNTRARCLPGELSLFYLGPFLNRALLAPRRIRGR